MKNTTSTAKALTDVELQAMRVRLAREIPVAQALLDAIQREHRRRKRARRTSQYATEQPA